MIEKHLVLEDIDPVMFYGVGNVHLQMLKALFPKLRIVARDNVIRVLGDEQQMAIFEESVEKMRQHVLKFNALKKKTFSTLHAASASTTTYLMMLSATLSVAAPLRPAHKTSNASSIAIKRTTCCSL